MFAGDDPDGWPLRQPPARTAAFGSTTSLGSSETASLRGDGSSLGNKTFRVSMGFKKMACTTIFFKNYTRAHTHTYIYICIYIYVYICIHIYIHIYIYVVCIYIYIYMYLFMFMLMYIYIYIYIYLYNLVFYYIYIYTYIYMIHAWGGRTIAEIGVYEPIVLGYVGISIHKPITIPPNWEDWSGWLLGPRDNGCSQPECHGKWFELNFVQKGSSLKNWFRPI